MKKRAILIAAGILIIAVVAWVVWLVRPGQTSVQVSAESSCIKCHGDQDRMAQLSERAYKYYVDPVQFAQEAHGGLACTTCHGGDPTKPTPQEACLNGKAHKNPAATELVSQTCGQCHAEITARNLKSIHSSLDGIRLSLVDLLGEKDGNSKFYATCNDCHTTCSSCHMETPDRRNMLWPRVTNHQFDARSNSTACAACHAGMGDTFFGTKTAPKHAPSLMAQAGIECVDCHGDKDVHGTGTKTQFSMQTPKPTCAECHSQPTVRVTAAKDTLVAPQYSADTPAHAMHPESAIACEACHTEWYPSCWNCHDGKTDKTVESLYLAVSPLTKKISPAAHSPAVSGPTGPVPTAVGGGWAIKSRHSWGASHTCEECHTDPAIYISGQDRQAPFVGYWTASRAKASFVDEKLIQALVIDKDKLAASAHRDQSCDDCHQSLSDAVCADCHAKAPKTGKTVLPADGDWSRKEYLAAQQNLDQSAKLIQHAKSSGMNVADWERQWNAWKSNYLQVSNDFHSNPGQALAQMKGIDTNSQALVQTVRQSTQAQHAQNQVLPAGLLIATGTIGAVALGLVARRQPKR